MRRRQALDAGIDAARFRDVAECEEVIDRLRIDVAGQGRGAGKGGHFRAEQQAAQTVGGVVQRLLAHPVTRQKQAAAIAVPQRDGEHAVQVKQAVRPPAFPRMHDGLGVRVIAGEHVAQRFQLRAQFSEIVNLAVEHDGDRAVLVEHRLMPARDVDHRKAAMAEPDMRLDMKPVPIRAAMRQCGGHAPQQRRVNRGTAGRVENAGQAAHRNTPQAPRAAPILLHDTDIASDRNPRGGRAEFALASARQPARLHCTAQITISY